MSRVILIGFGVGVVALGLAALLGGAGTDLARSGLAAWLVVMALPLGALPVLMLLELAGLDAMPGTAALRGLLAILPLAALLGAVGLGYEAFAPGQGFAALYGWSDVSGGFAARWFTPGWFGARTILYLVIWVSLAVVFMTPAARPWARRRMIAAWGLALHLVIGTLAAIDWTLSLDLGPNASVFGLLLMTLQCAFALTVALLVAAGGSTRPLRLMTLTAVATAAFLQFEQYLVVWSANLPREIVWYQHRLGGLGSVLFIAAPIILIVAGVVLVPTGLAARRWPLLAAAGLLALLEIADLLLLVTPAWRGTFSVSALDLLALIGVAGVLGAGALLISRRVPEARHG
ncbi:hypothetical protein [Beijerinckia sp. L45]|uniref:hypothetical protein n=1 Tax=Beijerinckia sp. L45 TaxID=1641855 RepID=UPI00131AEB90|nr:hypothetical protein [Beijerinckia sp. L45]